MVYEVIVDINNSELDKVFDYNAPFDVEIGQRVLVPFGRRQIEGYVIGKKDKSEYDTKDIIYKIDDFIAIKKELIELAKTLNEKYALRLADCLRLYVPSELRSKKVKVKQKFYVEISKNLSYEDALKVVSKRAFKQIEAIKLLEKGGEFESVINGFCGQGAVTALINKGIIQRKTIEIYRKPISCEWDIKKNISLSNAQKQAIEEINLQGNKKFLIHGVTGSGKTEIYMSIIENELKQGKTAIMLVPEISLTPQMLGVFRDRFKDKVAILHSGLSQGERYDEWRRLLEGKARVALGARSAIFAPLENLGAIIIDEEHDGSYVSSTNPRYITADIAEFRAEYNNAKLILGSATPSIDTYLSALNNDYHLIKLKDRVNKKVLPHMEIIDMREEVKRGNTSLFSETMLAAIDKTIKLGHQIMLFINRRGYASFIRCRNCGYIPKCPSCDVSLTYHRDENLLKCHYCAKKFNSITNCPMCDHANLKQGNIGTERVSEELNNIYPDLKVLRMDNDTITTKDSYREILDSFRKKEAQVLVGTQMIAKGHDFKDVTLVGILDADLSLYFSDYRSVERSFQLITQVAGRAGRESKEGRVIVQTYNPNHYVFRYASIYNYEGFFEKESNVRKATKFPPYSKILRVLISSGDVNDALQSTQALYQKIKALGQEKAKEIFRVQAMPAPIKRIENKYRYQVIIFIEKNAESVIIPLVFNETKNINKKGVSVFVEINPQQMM